MRSRSLEPVNAETNICSRRRFGFRNPGDDHGTTDANDIHCGVYDVYTAIMRFVSADDTRVEIHSKSCGLNDGAPFFNLTFDIFRITAVFGFYQELPYGLTSPALDISYMKRR